MGPGELGTTGNYWTSGDQWPSVTPKKLYLASGHKLSLDAVGTCSNFFVGVWAFEVSLPFANHTRTAIVCGCTTVQPGASDPPSPFVYDPAIPLPTIGGGNLLLPKCGPQDQSSIEDRADVLKFTSDALANTIAVTGEIKVSLHVSSTAVDTDFVVKVTDVFPSLGSFRWIPRFLRHCASTGLDRAPRGRSLSPTALLRTGDGIFTFLCVCVCVCAGDSEPKSMLVQDGIIRMRWREGDKAVSPTLMVPHTVYNVTVSLGPTSYVFNKFHRIRVTVASSNFPRFSVNPNTGASLVNESKTAIAANVVYTNQAHQSFLELPVVSLDELPEL